MFQRLRLPAYLSFLLTIWLVLLPLEVSARPIKPSIIDLGTLGGSNSWAFGINDKGQIVGASETSSGEIHAFLWEKGKMRDLGSLGEPFSAAMDINNRGQVVGNIYSTDEYNHAFLWEKGKMIQLPTLGGIESQAEDINNQGQIVGWADNEEGVQIAVRWDRDQVNDLDIGFWTYAQGINNRGQVIAYDWQSSYLLTEGDETTLDFRANAINEKSEIVGITGYPEQQAVLWEDGKIRVLGSSLDGLDVEDINNRTQVVGGINGGAVLWHRGETSFLGDLGGGTSVARGINNRGLIVGDSTTAAGETHAVLWMK